MYNQNENVPFNCANVHHSQNHDSHSPQEETPLPPPPLHQSECPKRYVTSEQGIYDNAYDRYEARPPQNLMPQPPPDIQDLNPRPIVNYPTSSAHIPNWELYSAHSATQHRTASFQPTPYSQTHSSYQSHETPHVPQFPPAQLNTWGYWNNPYCDNNNNSNIINSQYSQQSRRHSTPPFYPDQDNGEVTAGKIKPPYVIKACASCKASHVACDAGRPCQRCIRLGKTETCVDAKRKKRGRPKNSTKSQQQQSVPSTTDSAGSSSAEATPITTASTRDPLDQLLELSQLLGDEPSSDEQTATDYSAAPINRLERFPSPVSSERRATPLSPLSTMRASALDGQSSIRKQKSLPSSLAARTGSSTSPSNTPKRRHSHRSAQEAPTTTNIQPIMLQHYQSVQYPAAQLRHGAQPIQFQDPSAMALTAADMQGITRIRTPVPYHYPLASSTPSRAIHPLSAQLTYDDSDTETEYRSMHNHHNR